MIQATLRSVRDGVQDYVAWDAWAAGLFEGEGCFTQKSNRYATPSMSMSMTDRDVVERFHRVVGVGSVSGPHTESKPHYKPYWLWRLYGRDAVEALGNRFLPWLGDRRSMRFMEVLDNFDRLRSEREAKPRLPRVCKNGHQVLTAADETHPYPSQQRQCRHCFETRTS